MKTVKRITALALAAATALSLLAAAPAQAATYKVKTTATYNRQDGKWVKTDSTSYVYDSKGRVTSITNKYFGQRWDDEKQKLVSYTSTSVGTYKYDAKGRMTQFRRTENGKEASRQVFTYGAKKRTITFYSDGKLVEKQVSALNSKGQTTSVKEYDANSKLLYTETYSYNTKGKAKGRVAKITTKPVSGKSSVTTYTYSFSGSKLTKRVVTSPASKDTTTYYNNGNIKTSKYVSDTWTSEDRYDSKGNQTYSSYKDKEYGTSRVTTYENGWEKEEKATFIGGDGKTQKHTYTFKYEKKSGRVTQRIKYEGNTPIQKATFTYKKS